MKIEMLEKVMHGRDVFESGDVRTVDDDTGAYFCSMGWAKDVDGKVETVARDPKDVRVVPDKVMQKLTVSEG